MQLTDVKLVLANVGAGIIVAAIIASATLVAVALGIGPEHVPIILAIAFVLMAVVYFVLRTFLAVFLSPITHQGPVQIYPNQEGHKRVLVSRLKRAKEVRILTIRGARYFDIKQGWFRSDDTDPEILRTLLRNGVHVKVLLCSPSAPHLNPTLTEDQRRSLAMRNNLHGEIKTVCDEYHNIDVRVYAEDPVWNMLAFDQDVIYVSAYVRRKNERIALMYEFKEHPKSMFQGFHKHFECLWNRAQPLAEYLAKSI